jgi:hypothetical protein
MLTKDGFNPARSLPLVLADQTEQQGIGNACDGAVTSSRVLKASILIATATATGIAVLSVGNPVTLFADVTASLVGNSGLQPGTDQSTPTIQSTADAQALVQSTADAQALPPTATDAPTRDEIAASEPAGKDQTEKSEPPSEALFRQYQAWAAEKDAQAHVRPAQPVQDAPAQVVQNAPARVAENARVPHRLMQKHRHVVPVHNARAEMRTQNFRTKVRRAQSARVERPPIQDTRAQDQSVQNAQTLSLLPTVGLRN